MNRLEAGCLEVQIARETSAMIAIATHGQRGGDFTKELWANGRIMVSFPGATIDKAFPVELFNQIKAAGFKIRG